MAKYKILRGSHAAGHGADLRTYKRGEIIETPKNLEKLFGKDKFQRIRPNEDAEDAPAAPPAEAPAAVAVVDEDPYGLQKMTKKQLLEFAQTEGIEVSDTAMKKDEILNEILAVLGEE